MKRYFFRQGLKFLGFAILFVGLAGWAVMTLWNALLPDILGVKAITFVQALGLMLLSRLLFGGPGWRSGGWQRGEGRFSWKRKMAERMKNLSPEQRERMKAQWDAVNCRPRGFGRWNDPRSDEGGQADTNTTAI